jgi:UDP-glucose:(heptosyl)LPS alpha-1,3-glucosyltransferase
VGDGGRAEGHRVNVALVILHADPAKGGAETYTVDLARALADRGHAVSMLAATFSDALDPRVARVRLPHAGPTRLARYLGFLDGLDARLAEAAGAADGGSRGAADGVPPRDGVRRYDVVHAMLPVRRCDLYHPHAGIAAEAVAGGHRKHRSPLRRAVAKLANHANRKRVRFAAVERTLLVGGGQTDSHPDPARGPVTGTGQLAGRAAPVVICLSDYIKATVRRHYPLSDDRLATLVNAVDLAKFDPSAAEAAGRQARDRLGIAPDKVVALIVAQDFARKGLREAIEAWRLAADPRLVLLVVGKDDFGPYGKLAANAPHQGNLVYAGATADVRPFYAAADLFVLPTRHDPCSLVVLEALAMGLPVVSTKFNGACEVMNEGVHGFVLPDPADVSALADALRRTLDDAARAAMRAACLALRPRLAYDHHLDELLRLYERARAGRSPTSDLDARN